MLLRMPKICQVNEVNLHWFFSPTIVSCVSATGSILGPLYSSTLLADEASGVVSAVDVVPAAACAELWVQAGQHALSPRTSIIPEAVFPVVVVRFPAVPPEPFALRLVVAKADEKLEVSGCGDFLI